MILLLVERHAAALAVGAVGHLQKQGDGHIAGGCDELAHVDARRGLPVLPARYGLAGDVKPARHLLLRDARLLADGDDGVFDGHGLFLSSIVRHGHIVPEQMDAPQETARCVAAETRVLAPDRLE